jgi:hypothetical protein
MLEFIYMHNLYSIFDCGKIFHFILNFRNFLLAIFLFETLST